VARHLTAVVRCLSKLAGQGVSPLNCMFIGRRPMLILVLGVLLAVAGCIGAPVLNLPLAQRPQVVMRPGNGATDVNPAGLIRIAVRGGTFNVVGLTSPAGKAVIGQLSADNATWTVGEPIGYDKTYPWVGTIVDSDGVQMPVRGSFTPSILPSRSARSSTSVTTQPMASACPLR
jgi:Bacterial Ig domain